MDRVSLMDYLGHYASREDETKLLENMAETMPEEQFKDCLKIFFEGICEEESNVERTIEWAIEQIYDEIPYFRFDEEDDDSWSGISEHVKDSFDFVKAMFDAELDSMGVEFCERILAGLDSVSKKSKYSNFFEELNALKEELKSCMESKNYVQWFDY